MAADLTPDQVNERLNRGGGYAQGNLVIWAKIKEAIPWLEWEYRGYEYDNNKVLNAIDNNGFCLVEVDGSRIGGDRHWCLYIGGGQMYDPWYGTQKGTSYYPALGYSIINKISQPESNMYRGYDLTNQESMKVCVDDHIRIVEGELVDADKLVRANTQIQELIKQNEELSEELGKCRSEKQIMVDKMESLNKIIEEYNKEDAIQIRDLKQAQDERNQIKQSLDEFLRSIRDLLKLPRDYTDREEAISESLNALQSLIDAKEIQLRWEDYSFILKIGGKLWQKRK